MCVWRYAGLIAAQLLLSELHIIVFHINNFHKGHKHSKASSLYTHSRQKFILLIGSVDARIYRLMVHPQHHFMRTIQSFWQNESLSYVQSFHTETLPQTTEPLENMLWQGWQQDHTHA